MAPAYGVALLICIALAMTSLLVAVISRRHRLVIFATLLTSLFCCFSSVFISTAKIESLQSKYNLQYGWPLNFVTANQSSMDPPIGYKMRLQGQPGIEINWLNMITNYLIYLGVSGLLVQRARRTSFCHE